MLWIKHWFMRFSVMLHSVLSELLYPAVNGSWPAHWPWNLTILCFVDVDKCTRHVFSGDWAGSFTDCSFSVTGYAGVFKTPSDTFMCCWRQWKRRGTQCLPEEVFGGRLNQRPSDVQTAALSIIVSHVLFGFDYRLFLSLMLTTRSSPSLSITFW